MMLTRNLPRLAASLCFAVALAFGGHAEAGFDVSTSIFRLTGATNVMSGGGGSTYSVGTATITLTDYKTTGDTSTTTPAESIALTGPYEMDATIEVIENVVVTNPSLSGSSITFQVVADFTLTSNGLIADSASFSNTTITQQTLNGTTFTISNPQDTTTGFNATNASAITAVITPSTTVPEPSSLALCGVAGAIGVAFARTRRQRIGG